MAHLHITAWVLAFILLFIVSTFYKQGKAKPGKILHMILRLDYLIIIFSGGSLFLSYANYPGELFLKIIAGFWAIVAMEIISVRTVNSKPTGKWWLQFIIAAVIAIVLGFVRLPLGILP